MRLDEQWIRAHLPPDCRFSPIDCFAGEYLDGLTVMQEGERGGPDVVVYRAADEQDLRWWQLGQVCRFIAGDDPPKRGTWRYERHHADENGWYYVEHRRYDYNAIEDARLYGFECYLRRLHYAFPPERWEEAVREHVALMNYWYAAPHWDYDRKALRFIEISDAKERDSRDPAAPEEPRPGSVIELVD